MNDVAEVLDAYLRALETGNAPNREALLARHATIAEELAVALDGLDFVHRAGRNLASAPKTDEDPGPGKALGDYRLLREVGRGGMAVVYEAEQVSLGRHVALKVLPFAAVLDPKQLQRFKNEAMAAAHLRHPNIVPVYAVGCERGVHYYAMQYVEGESLAVAIRELKGGGTGEGGMTPISSHGSNREPAYIRMAAALGVQAAEALDHAHQLGIVHRDVKPGNLLVDLAGTLWITDFGLSSSKKDVGLTITGELLGTIRYMSPEQALAKRVPIDHRTDIYSLGATLYELFTLEPAVPGDDPHLVIQDIAFKEPVLPRRLNPVLPLDLETVLIKAMTKDPGGRYATAQEMADDLKRYLEDKPILARRPSLAARAARWSRRHRGLVAASFVVMLLAVAALAVDNIRVAHEEKNTKAALQTAKANLALARDAVEKFLVEAGIADPKDAALLPQARKAMLEAALEFYETNLDDPDSLWRRGEILHALHRYEETLAVFDRVLAILPGDARAHSWRGHQLWHLKRPSEALAAHDRSIGIDPTSARAHLYRGNALDDLNRPVEALAAFDRAIEIDTGYAQAHACRGGALESLGRVEDAVAARREAMRIEPNDATTHYGLGIALAAKRDLDGAIAAYREAIRLDPGHAKAHCNLGLALFCKGDREGAIREYLEAIRIQPDLVEPHNNLVNALADKGDLEGAMRECREAIRLKPEYAPAHNNLGNLLLLTGDPDGAMQEYREAIRLKPEFAEAHLNLGQRFEAKGDLDAAIQEYREGIRLRPDDAVAQDLLGIALRTAELEGRLDRVLSGEARPRDALERIEFAEVLYAKARHAESSRMYAEAFAEDAALAEDLVKGHRYNAAFCAALAAARGGADAAEWRGRTLEWLRADLAAHEKAPSGLAATLEHWKRDPDLAGVRDRVDELPAGEREDWTKLWADVDALLARAREGK